MTCSTAPLNCRSRNKPRAAGYALLGLMIMVAVLLVTLTSALPSVYQAGQREREAEAIFCGNQYARAVYLYYRRFGHYPASVKDLLNTDGTRFLRMPYKDPLARDGKWRFVHAAAGGILVDSWNQTTILPGLAAGAGTPGAVGTNNNAGASSGTPVSPAATPATQAAATENGKPKHPPSTCDSDSGESSDRFAGSTYQTGTLLGAYIVGVAPCNDKESIRVLDHQNHYDHWEFVGLNYREYTLPRPAQTGTQPAGMAGSQLSTPPPGSNGQTPSGASTPQP